MIGILDSGLGGLSVLNEIHRLMPDRSFLYLADSAWCPYGNKSYSEIQKRVSSLVDYLLAEGAEIIVIACNSATIACVEYLRANYLVPIVGMEPGVKPAAQATRNGVIGVLATEASLAGEKFHRLLDHHAQDVQVITQPCPDFVTLVEAGELKGQAVTEAIERYVQPMHHADTIVLGCTHYPFLKAEIAELYPDKKLIDTGEAVAQQVYRKSPQQEDRDRTRRFQTSGDPKHASERLKALCPQFAIMDFEPLEI